MEIWRDIEGYENRYQVSNLGNVKSLNYCGNTYTERILKPGKHHTGYLLVRLPSDNPDKPKNLLIHTLVAKAFIKNPDNKKLVNHKDGNKHNNTVSNLEWSTYKENRQHAIKTGLVNPHKNSIPLGNANFHSKPICQYTLDGVFVKQWGCISDAARSLNANPCQIINNAKGRNKTCHGYLWRYPSLK